VHTPSLDVHPPPPCFHQHPPSASLLLHKCTFTVQGGIYHYKPIALMPSWKQKLCPGRLWLTFSSPPSPLEVLEPLLQRQLPLRFGLGNRGPPRRACHCSRHVHPNLCQDLAHNVLNRLVLVLLLKNAVDGVCRGSRGSFRYHVQAQRGSNKFVLLLARVHVREPGIGHDKGGIAYT